MSITPETPIDISNIEMEEQPTLTFWRNPKTNRLEGTAEGLKAMAQAVEVILNTERYWWQIYSPYTGMEWEGLIGSDPGYVAAETQRRMKSALSMDPRILGMENYEYALHGDSMTVAVTVRTVFGPVQRQVEVQLT